MKPLLTLVVLVVFALIYLAGCVESLCRRPLFSHESS